MGSLYQRGTVWWLKYHHNGKPIRESSGSTKKMVAKRLLQQREAEIAQGKIPGIYFDRISFDELAEDFLRDYRKNEKKSLDRAENAVDHLTDYFKGMRATAIDTPRAQQMRQLTASSQPSKECSTLLRGALRRSLTGCHTLRCFRRITLARDSLSMRNFWHCERPYRDISGAL